MTFSLTLSSSDLLLLLPEIFLTCWLCVVLIVDFNVRCLSISRAVVELRVGSMT